MLVGSWEREKSPQAADHTSSCSALTTEKSGSGDVSWGRREVGRRERGKREGEFTRCIVAVYMLPLTTVY